MTISPTPSITPEPLFLTRAEVAELTDRHTKAGQIAQLKAMRLPFFISALGRPVVTREAVLGRRETKAKVEAEWEPGLAKKY